MSRRRHVFDDKDPRVDPRRTASITNVVAPSSASGQRCATRTPPKPFPKWVLSRRSGHRHLRYWPRSTASCPSAFASPVCWLAGEMQTTPCWTPAHVEGFPQPLYAALRPPGKKKHHASSKGVAASEERLQVKREHRVLRADVELKARLIDVIRGEAKSSFLLYVILEPAAFEHPEIQ